MPRPTITRVIRELGDALAAPAPRPRPIVTSVDARTTARARVPAEAAPPIGPTRV